MSFYTNFIHETYSSVKSIKGGHTEIYLGAEYEVYFVPKMKIEVAVSDHVVERAIVVSAANASTRKIGDGNIFLDIGQVIRIRPGETDEEAL